MIVGWQVIIGLTIPIVLVSAQSGLILWHCPTLFTPLNVVCDIFGIEYRTFSCLYIVMTKQGWWDKVHIVHNSHVFGVFR